VNERFTIAFRIGEPIHVALPGILGAAKQQRWHPQLNCRGRPLLRVLAVRDDDPVGQEAGIARAPALHAGLASLAAETSAAAATVREEFSAYLSSDHARGGGDSAHGELHRRALQAARERVLRMRANNEIGDDAFHQVEEDLDWLEMAGGPGDADEE
jgi:monovalent cation/hydrogen antiporter